MASSAVVALTVIVLLVPAAMAGFFFSGSPAVRKARDQLAEQTVGSGNTGKPQWPEWFTTSWVMYSTPMDDPAPPYTPLPLPPYTAGRGSTYYDWTSLSMLEVYDDFCVPIFVNGSNWRCHFLNTQNVSYLITFPGDGAPFPPCCVFLQPWQPPAPNFIDPIPYNTTANLYGQLSDWYVLSGSDPVLPFGYGFYEDSANAGHQIPSTFYFRGITGFTSQEFHSFQPVRPPASTWTIPPECNAAPNCGVM